MACTSTRPAAAPPAEPRGPKSATLVPTSLAIDSSGDLFGVFASGIYENVSGSGTWTALSSGLPATFVLPTTFGLDSSGILYAGFTGSGFYEYTGE